MTSRYIPPSIKSEGLESFLNATAHKHKGFGYKEFITLVEPMDTDGRPNVNISNLARAFSISRPTAVKWLEIYHEEQADKPTKKVAK